ncbi:MAG: hypothetical protein H7Y31_03520 [Chitinophagaceae bacterium]|nr:hypothetical protein [Chitinophagaceae bacterium]
MIKFAESNGWELLDSITIAAHGDQTEHYKITNADDWALRILKQEMLPVSKDSLVQVFIFKTGWIWVLDTAATERTGFVSISRDGRDLNIYHFWGQ